MDKNAVVVKGSFKGISGEFAKNTLILLISVIAFIICNSIKKHYYDQYGIKSFIEFVMELDEMKVIAILSTIFLLMIIIVIIAISVTFKIIVLLYEMQRTVVVDFTGGKIIVESFTFPFNKAVDENKFNEIISISINQELMDRTFGTGELYIEYLTYSKVDSQLRSLVIPYVHQPFKIKPRLI